MIHEYIFNPQVQVPSPRSKDKEDRPKDALLEMIEEMVEEENKAEVGDVLPRVKPDEMTSFVTRRIRCLTALQSDIPSKMSESEVQGDPSHL